MRFVGKNEPFRNKAPVFYSGLMRMRCGRTDRFVAEKMDGMMDERFAIFNFVVPLPRPRKPDWPKCASCAATFFLRRHDQPSLPLASTAAVPASSPGAIAETLRQLASLHAGGELDDEEYRAAKRRAIGL